MTYPTKKLGEVLELCDSGTWGDELSNGLPLLRSTNMQNGELVLDDVKYIDVPKEKVRRYTLREGDILITKSSGSVDHIGKSLFITKEMNEKYGFSNFTQRLRVDKNQVLPKWVYLKISNPATRDFLLGTSQTTTGLRNLKIPALKELEISLPPLSEQKKIVAKLERVLAKIGEAKKLRAVARKNADNLLSAELHKIFSTDQHPYKLENVGISSTGKNCWEEKTIEEVTELVTKGTTPKTLGHAYTESGVPFLKAENVNGGAIAASSTQTFISKQTHDILSRSKTKNGDVLMTIAGTIGRLGWIPEHAPEMNMNQAVAIIRPKRNLISSPYLAYILSAGVSQGQVSAGIVKAAIPNFSLGMIKKITIPLPPLAEQKKIVARLDSLSEKIEKIKNLQIQTAADFKTLEQSILHQAFSN